MTALSNYNYHRDHLAGSYVYGTYVPDPLANTTFAVEFFATSTTPVLLMTGDRSSYVYAYYGDVTGATYGPMPVAFSYIAIKSPSGTTGTVTRVNNGVNGAPFISLGNDNVIYCM